MSSCHRFGRHHGEARDHVPVADQHDGQAEHGADPELPEQGSILLLPLVVAGRLGSLDLGSARESLGSVPGPLDGLLEGVGRDRALPYSYASPLVGEADLGVFDTFNGGQRTLHRPDARGAVHAFDLELDGFPPCFAHCHGQSSQAAEAEALTSVPMSHASTSTSPSIELAFRS